MRGSPLVGTLLQPHRRLLARRGFRVWFAAALSAGLGDWLGLFALQVLVVSLGDPGSNVALFGLGGVMLARLLPSVLLGPAAGLLADRFDRKRLLVGTNVGRAALYAVVAFSRDLWAVLALVVAIECLTISFIAAKDALLPHLAERRDLTEANQLTLLVTYGPLPFGAGAAALMSWLAGWLPRLGLPAVEPTTAALLVNATAFLVAALLLTRMPLDQAARNPTVVRDGGQRRRRGFAGTAADLREGFAHVFGQRVIRSLTVGVVAVFFGAGMVIALGPEFVRTSLDRPGEDWYGLMTTVGGGLLGGMAIATVLARRLPKEQVFAAALVPASLLVVLVAGLRSLLAVQVVGAVLAVAAGTAFVLGFTLLHERTPDDLRGRTFASFYTLARVALFAALALGPFLAGVLGSGTLTLAGADIPYDGIRTTIALGGLAGLAGAVPALVGMVRATRQATPAGDGDAPAPAGKGSSSR